MSRSTPKIYSTFVLNFISLFIRQFIERYKGRFLFDSKLKIQEERKEKFMALDKTLKNEIEKELQQYTGKKTLIKEAIPVHGGDIHSSFQLITDQASFFLKTSPATSADLFRKELKGLQLLMAQKVIALPKTLNYGNTGKESFLLMEFIPKESADADFWKTFAKGIADLHRCTNDFYGLNEDNYIGTLPQSNRPHENWPDFFISQRLQPLIKKCIDQNLLDTPYMEKAMHLYNRMPEIFPGESPALLHGDL